MYGICFRFFGRIDGGVRFDKKAVGDEGYSIWRSLWDCSLNTFRAAPALRINDLEVV